MASHPPRYCDKRKAPSLQQLISDEGSAQPAAHLAFSMLQPVVYEVLNWPLNVVAILPREGKYENRSKDNCEHGSNKAELQIRNASCNVRNIARSVLGRVNEKL